MDTRVSPKEITPVSVSDEALVRRLLAGDDWAGEDLAKRHCSSLVRYLQRLVHSDHLAEELHQQTWASVLENLDRFDLASGEGGFKAWLYRIATNKAHDHWRSRGREKKVKEGLRLVTEELAPDAGHRMEGTGSRGKAPGRHPIAPREPEGNIAAEVLRQPEVRPDR